MLYFAYGSNLNVRQMALRCPDAEKVGPADLRDHRLVFKGVADVIPARGVTVRGGLWKITPECEVALDRYEGVKSGLYRRVWVDVQTRQGTSKALCYRMNRGEYAPPMEYYLDTIIQGFRDFGLHPRSLRDAVIYTGDMMDQWGMLG